MSVRTALERVHRHLLSPLHPLHMARQIIPGWEGHRPISRTIAEGNGLQGWEPLTCVDTDSAKLQFFSFFLFFSFWLYGVWTEDLMPATTWAMHSAQITTILMRRRIKQTVFIFQICIINRCVKAVPLVSGYWNLSAALPKFHISI
jgi:hypothetical protein